MEIRVWMDEGVRAVSGVVEQTTCRDVVVALAQALGRTGRYVLVERLGGMERRLSPSESLLRVVQKRGVQAKDIQFILRHSNEHKRRRRKLREQENETENKQVTTNGAHSQVIEDNISSNLLKNRNFDGMDNLNLIGHSNGDMTKENGNLRKKQIEIISRDSYSNSQNESEQSSMTSHSPTSFHHHDLDLGAQHQNGRSSQSNGFLFTSGVNNGGVNKHITNNKLVNSRTVSVDTNLEVSMNGSRKSSSSSTNFSPMSSISSEVSSENSKPGKVLYGTTLTTFEEDISSKYIDNKHNADLVNNNNKTNNKLESNMSPISDKFISLESKYMNQLQQKATETTNKNHYEPFVLQRTLSEGDGIGQVDNLSHTNNKSNLRTKSNAYEEVEIKAQHLKSISVSDDSTISELHLNNKPTNATTNKSGDTKGATSVKDLRKFFTDAAAASGGSTNALNAGMDRQGLLDTVRQQQSVIQRQLQQLEELQSEISSIEESFTVNNDNDRITESLATSPSDDEKIPDVSIMEDELEKLSEELRLKEEELADLELVSWEDKVFMEREKEKRIDAELLSLKENISVFTEDIEEFESFKSDLLEKLRNEEKSAQQSDTQDIEIELNEKRLKNGAAARQLSDLRAECESTKNDTEERRTKISKLQSEILQTDQQLLKHLNTTRTGELSGNRVNV